MLIKLLGHCLSQDIQSFDSMHSYLYAPNMVGFGVRHSQTNCHPCQILENIVRSTISRFQLCIQLLSSCIRTDMFMLCIATNPRAIQI